MTRQETGIIMNILTTAYPRFYSGQDAPDPRKTMSLWAEMFRDDPVELVAAAVKALIATDEKGFPPHIGAVKASMRKLVQPDEMTEMEAWRLVRQAIRGASMSPSSRRITAAGGVDNRSSAQRHFEELPPILQRVVGGPEQLAAWEQISNEQIDTVIQSNFMRSYRARAQQEREFQALPQDVRAMIGQAIGRTALEDGG